MWYLGKNNNKNGIHEWNVYITINQEKSPWEQLAVCQNKIKEGVAQFEIQVIRRSHKL